MKLRGSTLSPYLVAIDSAAVLGFSRGGGDDHLAVSDMEVGYGIHASILHQIKYHT